MLMKVARIHGPGDIRVTSEPQPEVQDGESLVRVTAVGLCGSDLHWFHSGGIGDAKLDVPLVLGHEFAGVVEGGDLDGALVAVDPARPCFDCRECDEGHRNLCTNVRFAGHGTNDGGLRQYVSWPTKLLQPLPDGMDAIDGAILEPLGVAIHAWDLAHVLVGQRLGIVGAGPIGILTIRLAKAAGVPSIIVIEPIEHRQQAARQAGADVVLDPTSATFATDLAHHASDPVDVVIEISNAHEGATHAVDLVKVGGRVVLAGIPDSDITQFPAATARRKGLSLKASRRMGEAYPRAIELVSAGLMDLGGLATHRFGIDDTAAAFAAAHAREGLKVVIEPWG